MVNDWRGTEIKVGSIVVYPTRSGSWMSMNEGEVLGIVHREYYGRKFFDVKVQGKGKSRPGLVDGGRATVIG